MQRSGDRERRRASFRVRSGTSSESSGLFTTADYGVRISLAGVFGKEGNLRTFFYW